MLDTSIRSLVQQLQKGLFLSRTKLLFTLHALCDLFCMKFFEFMYWNIWSSRWASEITLLYGLEFFLWDFVKDQGHCTYVFSFTQGTRKIMKAIKTVGSSKRLTALL